MSTVASVIPISFRLAAERIVQRAGSRLVVLSPVHSSDPADPNKSYSTYSPQAKFEFLVTNPNVFPGLEPEAIYKIVMVREDSGATIEVVMPDLPAADTLGEQTGDLDPPTLPVADPALAAGVTGDGAPTPPVTPPVVETPVGDPPADLVALPVSDPAPTVAAPATDAATAVPATPTA